MMYIVWLFCGVLYTSFQRWTQWCPHDSLGARGLWHSEARCFLTLEQIWKGNLYLWKQRLSMLAKDTYPQNNSCLLLALPMYFTDISLVLDFWEKVSSYSTTCTVFVLGTKLYYIQDRHIQAWVFIWDLANLQKPQVNGVRNVQRNSFVWTRACLSG